MSGPVHSYRTEAVVLRRSDFGEADRLLTLYTVSMGKVTAVAKSSRKPQSRMAGHIELFTHSNFFIAAGRSIDIVTQVETVESFAELRMDLIRTTYAAYMVELLDKFSVEQDRNVGLFNLLTQSLGALCKTDNMLLLARYFELKLLTLTGFQPELFIGVVSGEEIVEEDQFFSFELGGLVKPNALRSERRARPVSAAAVKVLRYLQTRSWETVEALQLRRSLHTELEDLLHNYIAHQLERNLKSVDFLKRLRYETMLYGDD